MDTSDLIQTAREAKTNAYSEYSDFAVGAALLTHDGDVYAGCNVENINFTNTIHAEQTALVCAVNDGRKRDEFAALAISTSGDDTAPPCGLCRQSLSELCQPKMPVYVDAGEASNPDEYTVRELLPGSMREHVGDL